MKCRIKYCDQPAEWRVTYDTKASDYYCRDHAERVFLGGQTNRVVIERRF